MAKSKSAPQLIGDMWELAGWMSELLYGVWSYQVSLMNVCVKLWSHCYQDWTTGALHNHINNSTDFLDSSSTALCAAATYRLAVLTGDCSLIWAAERAFDYIGTQIGSDGTLLNAVDPLSWDVLGTQTPEGQAFVLLLQAAWKDYTTWKRSGAPATLFTIW